LRRLLVIGLALVLGGLILASAADLGVSGGTLQVLRYEIEISGPEKTPRVDSSSPPATTPISTPVSTSTP
jgi:hypothetical protein